jgi:hypothetical protein
VCTLNGCLPERSKADPQKIPELTHEIYEVRRNHRTASSPKASSSLAAVNASKGLANIRHTAPTPIAVESSAASEICARLLDAVRNLKRILGEIEGTSDLTGDREMLRFNIFRDPDEARAKREDETLRSNIYRDLDEALAKRKDSVETAKVNDFVEPFEEVWVALLALEGALCRAVSAYHVKTRGGRLAI